MLFKDKNLGRAFRLAATGMGLAVAGVGAALATGSAYGFLAGGALAVAFNLGACFYAKKGGIKISQMVPGYSLIQRSDQPPRKKL